MATDAHRPGDSAELSKSYGPVHAVRDLDLSVAAGEIVAVLGPNGAGKSTLNELILGLVSPDAGRVAVFGDDPRARRAARPGRGDAAGRGPARRGHACTTCSG